MISPLSTTNAARDRVFYDIAQVLESVAGPEERVTRALELLQAAVPYEQCAVLDAQPGRVSRVFVVPGTPPKVRAQLKEKLYELMARLTEERRKTPAATLKLQGSQLAVPLIGLDREIGLIMVYRGSGDYDESDLRALSVVAANLGAYLALVRARVEEADRRRELEEARRLAEAANRAKDEFIALISHELKTPLASTLACAHFMIRAVDDSARSYALQTIERNILAQGRLIDEILDLSCISTGRLQLDLQPVEPVRSIRNAIDGLRLRAEERSIEIACTLDESVGLLHVDPDRFCQVLSNLLANAIKFAANAGRVEVRLESSGEYARIRIIDDGEGISAEFLPHVFDCFRQEGGATTRKFGGLGTGLAIAKNLVERQGGRIRAESEGRGKGATFTVELPFASDGPALAGVRVLLVDDDDDIRFAFQTILERHGAEVIAVDCAASALETFERMKPDVLLSDLDMAGGSGYELMRELSLRDRTVPAAALTAHGRAEERERTLAAGFKMHVKKPVTAVQLVETVSELAGRRSAQSGSVK